MQHSLKSTNENKQATTCLSLESKISSNKNECAGKPVPAASI